HHLAECRYAGYVRLDGSNNGTFGSIHVGHVNLQLYSLVISLSLIPALNRSFFAFLICRLCLAATA
ncbi:hypothetical protein, partial [Klebsiella pneumoniae]|uniref:hypothetical protein n=1 Tax=Klebsiella pneumoniae TaxID=573 RepID=UPI001C70A032